MNGVGHSGVDRMLLLLNTGNMHCIFFFIGFTDDPPVVFMTDTSRILGSVRSYGLSSRPAYIASQIYVLWPQALKLEAFCVKCYIGWNSIVKHEI